MDSSDNNDDNGDTQDLAAPVDKLYQLSVEATVRCCAAFCGPITMSQRGSHAA